MVFSKGPGAAALKPATILSSLPLAIGCSGLIGVVQPQLAVADSITTTWLLVFLNGKECVTGTPCLIFPKSYFVSANLIRSGFAACTVAVAAVAVACC